MLTTFARIARPLALTVTAAALLVPAAALAASHDGGRGHAGLDALDLPFSIDVQHASLRGLIELLADTTNLNVVMDPGIDGKVTLKLDDVTWRLFLDKTLPMYDLAYLYEGNVLLIMPEGHSAFRPVEPSAPVQLHETRIVRLSYADPDDTARLLEGVVLSDEGTVVVDRRTSSLIIRDRRDRVQEALALIGHH